MPPEAFGGKADARGDIYSLGLTLYEMLAFRPAFDESDRGQLVKQVTTEEPPRLKKLNPEVPRDLETIVQKAIERDPHTAMRVPPSWPTICGGSSTTSRSRRGERALPSELPGGAGATQRWRAWQPPSRVAVGCHRRSGLRVRGLEAGR